ncbi:transcriptional regulator, GntR family [Bosea sp. OK403]|uniref:GntR family transcriptional regulator n=1 Tax=Bosea sp. OK403 TaxID=1855286 RepID=UPI0008F4440E|nr:GntR family transcriptional regulator [Bosea sp. OK403]SFJ29737.1 transcriptional regulator, GntR family [Bosea sp. OK403]
MSPRYSILATALLEQIAAGKHPVGHLLPSEHELAELHDVSRSTVRAALLQLQNLGVISRRRGAGTLVEASRPTATSAAYNQSLGTFDDLVQYADATERRVLEMADVVADDDLARRLQSRPGRRWLHVSAIRVRTDDDAAAPICWTDLYIDGDYAALMRRELPSYRHAVAALIEERHGRRVSEIRQTIRAAGLTDMIARTLAAATGDHALEITRRYVDAAGIAFITTFSLHPGDRFAYEMRLQRRAASGG